MGIWKWLCCWGGDSGEGAGRRIVPEAEGSRVATAITPITPATLPVAPARRDTRETGETVIARCEGLTITRLGGGSGSVVVRRRCNQGDLRNLVLSGGGAKGCGYPGALSALVKTGVAAGVRNVFGTSAGAVTAALFAGGVGEDALLRFFNEYLLANRILDVSTSNSYPLVAALWRGGSKGEGIRKEIDRLLKKSVLEFLACQPSLPPEVATIAERLRGNAERKGLGLTFGELDVLQRHYPERFKQLHVYATKLGEEGQAKAADELREFSADATPREGISGAVFASMCLPGIYKPPVRDSGFGRERLADGGLFLNTPSPDVLHPERFALQGHFHPDQALHLVFFPPMQEADGRPSDPGLVFRTLNSSEGLAASAAADNALLKNPLLPTNLCVLPTRVTWNGKEHDLSGLQGTVGFDMPRGQREAYQQATEAAVRAHIEKRNRMVVQASFGSLESAFLALPLEDLRQLHADTGMGKAHKKLLSVITEFKKVLDETIAAAFELKPEKAGRAPVDSAHKLLKPLLAHTGENGSRRYEFALRALLDPELHKNAKRTGFPWLVEREGQLFPKADPMDTKVYQFLCSLKERQRQLVGAVKREYQAELYPVRREQGAFQFDPTRYNGSLASTVALRHR